MKCDVKGIQEIELPLRGPHIHANDDVVRRRPGLRRHIARVWHFSAGDGSRMGE